ncbi:hypothetical protein [Prosthecochloris sp. HL-130-GSB]|jgi:hypothetical protein|uniref:hypothetical protein n=1 Tax=Prosthecochloris sp. HL-130-GSB TaxID=1974213 RepID=UPI0012F51E04|nr:hypothetical protein [Prosthecochloris sp. HL-130-GSB]
MKYFKAFLFVFSLIAFSGCQNQIDADYDTDVNDEIWEGYGESDRGEAQYDKMPKIH